MTTSPQPATAPPATGAKRIIVSEDLPLTVLTAVATTLIMNALGLDRTLLYVGVALSPLVADVIKNAFHGLRKRWFTLLAALLVLLGTAGRSRAARLRAREHRVIGWQAVTTTALVSAALTVAFFTVSELGRGSAILAARKTTFFGDAHAQKIVPPQLHVPADFVVPALGPTVVTYHASAHGSVDGRVTPVCAPRSGARFALGPTVVRCTLTDSLGARASKTFTITVRRVPLVLHLPETISLEAAGPTGASAQFRVSATGVAQQHVAAACAPSSESVFPIGTTRVTCSALDAAGHRARGQFIVVVRDDEPPTLHVPGDLSGTSTGASGRAFAFTVAAVDRVDGQLQPHCDRASGSSFPLGTTTVTCTAKDAHGNAATGSFVVTVAKPSSDKTAPVLLVPAHLKLEAASRAGAVVTYRAAAHDGVDGSLAARCVPASGATFPLGSTTVRCSAHDTAANLVRGTFVVTVVDTTPPTLATLPDLTAEATSPSGAAISFKPSATDRVDGVVAPRCEPAPGSTFPVGATKVTCTATDAHGNRMSAGFGVTVVDTTPPVLKLPGDLTVEATSAGGATVSYNASATDGGGGGAPSCTRPPGPFPLGPTIVTCTAADAHGNRASGSFKVDVVDTTPPALKLPGAMTVEATSASGASVTYTVSAIDAVSGTVTPSCSRGPGAFPLGQSTVTCTATDARGNRASGNFSVNVVDTTPPTLKLPGTLTVEATSRAGGDAAFTVSAVDAVTGAVNPSCSQGQGAFPFGQTTVTCTAIDARGNKATGSFTVNVVDTTPPTLTLPKSFTIAGGLDPATGVWGATVIYPVPARAVDSVDPKVPVSCSIPNGTFVAADQTTKRTIDCSAVDSHGNEAKGSFTVAIRIPVHG